MGGKNYGGPFLIYQLIRTAYLALLYAIFGPHWFCWLAGKSKTAATILIFSIFIWDVIHCIFIIIIWSLLFCFFSNKHYKQYNYVLHPATNWVRILITPNDYYFFFVVHKKTVPCSTHMKQPSFKTRQILLLQSSTGPG